MVVWNIVLLNVNWYIINGQSNSQDAVLNRIKLRAPPAIPETIQEGSRSLFKKLLVKNPLLRLGKLDC